MFLGEDIRQQLPVESNEFDKITLEWKEITSCLYKDQKALSVLLYPSKFLNLILLFVCGW